MSDPLTWSIPLVRWAGVQVRVHVLLIGYVVSKLLFAALDPGHPVVETAAWLSMLLLVLLLHELGHLAMASRLGVEPEEVRLWPLGNFVGPLPPYLLRGTEPMLVAAGGLIVSGALALSVAIGLHFADARMVFNPFGNSAGGGAPWLADGKTLAAAFSARWWIGWFGYLNWVLFLANLIPALPLDGGRIFRGLMEGPWSGPSRDAMIGHWTSRVAALVLGLGGLFRVLSGAHNGVPLIFLGLTIYLIARFEARMLDDGGFFDDGIFGYDFSQGYTSLEAGAATVRPRREGALKRWRRRRSEMRLRRRLAKEAAEEQRMDEILDKIHREGRASLTADEQRFLVRVSVKYRNRTKSSD